MVLVQRLAKGQDTENSKIILVTDSISNKTTKNYFKNFSEKVFKANASKLLIIDGGIIKNSELETVDYRIKLTSSELFETNGKNLIIDDLTPLLLNHSLSKISNWLVSKFDKVLIRISLDLISENDFNNLLNLANLTVNLIEKFSPKIWKNVNQKVNISNSGIIGRVRLCTGQGRVVSQVLAIESEDSEISVHSIEKRSHVERVFRKNEQDEQERSIKKDIKMVTSFNLNVNETEDEARKSIVLPFQTNSKIEYIPDDDDDYDESDPDDDLDI